MPWFPAEGQGSANCGQCRLKPPSHSIGRRKKVHCVFLFLELLIGQSVLRLLGVLYTLTYVKNPTSKCLEELQGHWSPKQTSLLPV